MRILLVAAGCIALALIAACGGGGGGGGGGSAPAGDATQLPAPAPGQTIAAPAQNVQALSVDPGPTNNAVNLLYTTVTVCAPGSSANCQTIDHVLVDTASTGLRIVSSVLSPSFIAALTPQNDAIGNPIAECAQFAGGFSWGPVKIADVRMSGELAASVPIQVVGDPAFPAIPASCSSTGPAHNTVGTLLANGLLGVGMFRQDCGNRCATSPATGIYFSCPPSGCIGTAVTTNKQVTNPVVLFAIDNNGVIIELPQLPATGAATVSGSLVFGIGTRANNALGSATVYPVDAATGTLTTVYKSQTLNLSFFDSGSNAFFFPDNSIARCSNGSGFYCPGSTLNLSATVQGTNGTSSVVNFSVADTTSLLQMNPNGTAFNNLAGPLGGTNAFDWGLPFFFGRNVFTAISGASTPAGAGPYIAF